MRNLPVPLLPRLVRWLGVLSAAAVIFYFSVLDTVAAPGGGGGPLWDKQLHFLAYAGLTAATAYATATWERPGRRRAAAVLLGVLLYGLGIELVQGTLTDRYFSPADLLANVIGVALGSLWFAAERYLAYRRLPAQSRNSSAR
ncbi:MULTISPECIES: VanZ family protein [Halolamina]|uniref:VanZ like family protein n=1 Tax=Halolamina pelagica TaxID=699431 RepID=A0A1I5U023_9EURY|nr:MULTISPECIES: VanZ family protein [Halolamina]NHX36726.1 hypothetical protein [Halolamina sp. R1-12]SFP88619.1 VanZ like family protein [Halolamina pelagica]